MQIQASPTVSPQVESSSCFSYFNPCTLFERVTTNWRQSAAIAAVALCMVGLVTSILTGTLLAIVAFAVTGVISAILASELEVLGNLKQTAKDFYDRGNELAVNLKLQDMQLEVFVEENNKYEKLNKDLEFKLSTFEASMVAISNTLNGAAKTAESIGGRAASQLSAASKQLDGEWEKVKALGTHLSGEHTQRIDALERLIAALSPQQAEAQLERAVRLQAQVEINEKLIVKTNAILEKLEQDVNKQLQISAEMREQTQQDRVEDQKRRSAERISRETMLEEYRKTQKELVDNLKVATTQVGQSSQVLQTAAMTLTSPFVPRQREHGSSPTSLVGPGVRAQAGAPIDPKSPFVARKLFDDEAGAES